MYGFTITDSIGESRSISLAVQGCTSISINEVRNTTCGNNNGLISGTTTVSNYPVTSYLYRDQILVGQFDLFTPEFSYNNLSLGLLFGIVDGGNTSVSQTVILESSTLVEYDYTVEGVPQCNLTGGSVNINITAGESPYKIYFPNGFSGTENSQYALLVTVLVRPRLQ